MTLQGTTVVVRQLDGGAVGLAITGDLTTSSEGMLLDAYARATAVGASLVILDFAQVAYMNSGGIGLLVTLLIRARADDRRLMAVGLSAHYRQILGLTRLDESIAVFATEAEAIAAAGA